MAWLEKNAPIKTVCINGQGTLIQPKFRIQTLNFTGCSAAGLSASIMKNTEGEKILVGGACVMADKVLKCLYLTI